jgi:ferric iron reductase protein FhuF
MSINNAPVHWPERYHQLLASAGLNTQTVLSTALKSQKPGHHAVLSLGQCLREPWQLLQQVQANYTKVTDKRSLRTHVSVMHLDLVQSVIAPLVLRLFLYGKAPLPEVDHVFLGPVKNGRVMARWFQETSDEQVGVGEFIARLALQLNNWYPVFRKELGISPGAYWSSTGLALGAPFSAVWNTVDPGSVCALAQEWLMQFTCEASRFIEWVPAESAGQRCAIPQRRGCCLKYLLPKGHYCGTCGVYKKNRLAGISQPERNSKPEQWQPAQ